MAIGAGEKDISRALILKRTRLSARLEKFRH